MFPLNFLVAMYYLGSSVNKSALMTQKTSTINNKPDRPIDMADVIPEKLSVLPSTFLTTPALLSMGQPGFPEARWRQGF